MRGCQNRKKDNFLQLSITEVDSYIIVLIRYQKKKMFDESNEGMEMKLAMSTVL